MFWFNLILITLTISRGYIVHHCMDQASKFSNVTKARWRRFTFNWPVQTCLYVWVEARLPCDDFLILYMCRHLKCHVCCWVFVLPFIAKQQKQAVNWFLYSYKTPIFWVGILYSEKPPIFPIFSYILNIIPIFFSELVAALPKTLLFLLFFCSLRSHFMLN